jgi:hypothetical protein
MTYDCPTCGREGSVKEYSTDKFSDRDYANINIFSEDPTHSLDVLYLLPPWRCEFCLSVFLRGKGDNPLKETNYTCSLCKDGGFIKFENASVGDIVVRDTFEKVGALTIDEAVICDKCSFLRVMETGKEVED